MDTQDDISASAQRPFNTNAPGVDEKSGQVSSRIVIHFRFYDRDGSLYHVDYFQFPGPSQDTNRRNLEDPEMAGTRQALEALGPRIFPNYDEQMLAHWIRKFATFSRFDLVYTSDGRLIAFHIYKMGEVQSSKGPVTLQSHFLS